MIEGDLSRHSGVGREANQFAAIDACGRKRGARAPIATAGEGRWVNVITIHRTDGPRYRLLGRQQEIEVHPALSLIHIVAFDLHSPSGVIRKLNESLVTILN